MQDKLQGMENTPPAEERRACARLRVISLIYIDIGGVNAGIVTSVSENGLALTAADTLTNSGLEDGPLRMRIQFPGIPEAIETSGEIVSTSSSGKEACVRFVELDEKVREQIRKWISDQASKKGLRAATKLPKMRLPNSRRVKARASRFSFSDVASSRIDPEGEAGVEGLPEITGEPGELPPFQVEAAAFRDGAEAVASAFKNPALTEDQTGNTPSTRNKQTTHARPVQDRQQPPRLSMPERRRHSRRQILLFTYAALGEDNGGIVFDLGEGGLALTAAASLQEHHFAKIRLRFPDSEDWIETSGRLAWQSNSGKEAGIEFLSLPEDARARIKEWVMQEAPADDAAAKQDDVRASQGGVRELPHFMEPRESSTEPFEIPASFQEQPYKNRTFEERRAEEPAKRRVAKIKPPRLALDSAKPRTRVARKALASAAGIGLAAAGWMFLRRTSTNEASGIIAQEANNPQPGQEPLQKPDVAEPRAGATRTASRPPIQSGESATTQEAQTDIARPLFQQIDSTPQQPNTSKSAVASQNLQPESALKQKSSREETLEEITSASSQSLNLNQAQRPTTPQREQSTKSSQVATLRARPSGDPSTPENKAHDSKSAEFKPAESKPVLMARAMPAQNSVQNNELIVTPPSLNSNPSQPAATSSLVLGKEKPPEPPKQPEPLVARTPVVTVSFDPYPSIRMPKTEKSKKSHQGKTLQMGRLLARVDPVYPEEARQQGIEGTVKVHAVFKRDGGVQSVTSLSGPPLLLPAAMNAVRQWRYSQTILGGQAMETEEDITLQFRLANAASKN